MTDTVSKLKRSEMMGKIRSKNTKPEIVVRQYLHSLGYRFRLHKKGLPGKPDIVLAKYHTTIFVHGCFWHGHKCKIGSGDRKPKTNQDYWIPKIQGNIERFEKYQEQLENDGWRVIVIWECETKNNIALEKALSELEKFRKNGK